MRVIDGKTIIVKSSISTKRLAPHIFCNEWIGVYQNEEVLVSEWNFKYSLDLENQTLEIKPKRRHKEPTFQKFLKELDLVEEKIKRFPTLTDQTFVVPYLICTVERRSVISSFMDISVIIVQKIKEAEQSFSKAISSITYHAKLDLCRRLADHAVCALRWLHKEELFHGAISANCFWFSDNTFRLSDVGTLARLLTLADIFTKCIVNKKVIKNKRYTQMKDLIDLGIMFDGVQAHQLRRQNYDLTHFITACRKAVMAEELFYLPYLKCAESRPFGLDRNSRYLIDFIQIKSLVYESYGKVWLARKKVDNKNYAIKMILLNGNNEKWSKKIKKEASWLAQLNHPNIVRFYGVWIENDQLFIQIEFFNYVTLWSFIHNKRLKGDSKKLWKMFREILFGLAYIHEQGMIHRDLKPMNIMVDKENHIKLVDFGLATHYFFRTLYSQNMYSWEQTKSTEYMAPELTDRNINTPISSKIDVYSAGVVLFELFYTPPSDGQERIHAFESLRRIKFPPYFVQEFTKSNVYLAKHTIKMMIQHKAEDRPTVDELLMNAKILNSVEIFEKCQKPVQIARSTVPFEGKGTQILVLGGWDGKNTSSDIFLLDYNDKIWKKVSIELPEKVYGHGTVVLKDELYIIGGEICGIGYSRNLYRLNKKMEWEKLADMHEERDGITNSCLVYNKWIWVIGGSTKYDRILNTMEKYDPVTNRWKKEPPMKRRRSFAAAAVINNKIYVCGGIGALSNSVEVFDIKFQVWNDFCTLPAPRYSMSIFVDGTNIILIGGSKKLKIQNTGWKMNVKRIDKNWRKFPILNAGRRDSSTVTIETGCILVFGGEINYQASSSVERFSGQKWESFTPLPQPRVNHTSVVLTPAMIDAFRPFILENIQILVIGGFHDEENRNSDIILLDYNDKLWKQLSTELPQKIYGHGTVILEDELYIIGGYDAESKNDCYTLYRLNKKMEWEKLADMHEKRFGITNCCLVYNKWIWVIGGCFGYHTYLNTMEKYDPATNTWEQKPAMNRQRRDAAAVVINDRIYVCGGEDDKIKALDSVEVFDISSEVWTDFCTMPQPRVGMSIVVEGTSIVLIGGEYKDTRQKTVWKMDVEGRDKEWIDLPSLNEGRKDSSAVMIETECILLFGGVNELNESSSSVELFSGQIWDSFTPLPEARHLHSSVVLTPAMIQAFKSNIF